MCGQCSLAWGLTRSDRDALAVGRLNIELTTFHLYSPPLPVGLPSPSFRVTYYDIRTRRFS